MSTGCVRLHKAMVLTKPYCYLTSLPYVAVRQGYLALGAAFLWLCTSKVCRLKVCSCFSVGRILTPRRFCRITLSLCYMFILVFLPINIQSFCRPITSLPLHIMIAYTLASRSYTQYFSCYGYTALCRGLFTVQARYMLVDVSWCVRFLLWLHLIVYRVLSGVCTKELYLSYIPIAMFIWFKSISTAYATFKWTLKYNFALWWIFKIFGPFLAANPNSEIPLSKQTLQSTKGGSFLFLDWYLLKPFDFYLVIGLFASYW